MTLEIQALTMIHMVGAGAYLGASFDTFARLRLKKKNQWVTIIQDMMFWLLNGLFVFIWLKYVNEGEMRIYIFLSLLCGFAFYKAFLQNFYQYILEWLLRVSSALYRFIVKICMILIIAPLYWFYQFMITSILFCTGVVIEAARYLYKLIQLLSQPVCLFFIHWYKKIKGKKDKKNKKDDPNNKNETLVGVQKEGIFRWMAKWLFKK